MQDESWHWQEPGTAWKGVGIYHVTLKIPTCEPLLGDLVIPNNDPTKAWVNYSDLGKAILECQRLVSSYHPQIQILHYCLMPDHLHSIWYVKQRMPRGILTAVRGFWQGAKKAAREYFSSVTPDSIRQDALFTQMPHIRPMGQRRQLPATLRYIDMNPQRLATMRLMPGFFCVQDNIEIAGRTYAGVGNADLLQRAKYMPVHVRRTMVEEAEHGDDKRLREYVDGCLDAARQGTVMVSPFIHEKEREVLYSVLSKGGKVIYLADNGFGEFYKPSDGIFDAVAKKQVLILSPWPYDPKKRSITRAECVALNQMAEEISSVISNIIRE